MAGKGISADIPRLKTFMRDLKKIDPALAKATNRRFRDAANPAAEDARRRVRVNKGMLRRSIRPRVLSSGAAIVATARHAKINEYGGRHRVFGRDVWVTMQARPAVTAAAAAHRTKFHRAADDAVKEAAREAGFK